jgi:cellulose synthase/poly-beta-1,6-N-acetylglucosamine synthase-like glycosyltransferase
MIGILAAALLGISALLLAIYSYYILVSMAGYRRFFPALPAAPTKSFAIIIPAHNEETVIGSTVASLMNLAYPRRLFDVFVIADNCTDRTAEAAVMKGAIALERHNHDLVGKGHALQWAFDRIRSHKAHDAYIILDADNITSRNLLSKLNNELHAGHEIMQCYLGTKNPNDSWVTRTIHLTYCFMNRFFQLPRERFGLCVPLGGTGVVLTGKILDTYGWSFTSLTEDLELTARLALDGIRVRWVHDAKVYDEKPVDFHSAFKQRQRWMTGHADVMTRYAGKLLWRGLRDRNKVALDAALYLSLPLLMTVWFFLYIAGTVVALRPFGPMTGDLTGWSLGLPGLAASLLFTLWWIMMPLYALKLEGTPPTRYWYTSLVMFGLAWVMLMLFIYGLAKRNDKRWWHTRHSAPPDAGIQLD